ncbi:unnamed protein product [Kuraishia capsulata CBS 1993]|uniref:Amino acid permease/ SLC12A domain-containing protein n=1 Tax=Kuraishia capsulata CBS 1993 TaxID=1382522 RepID=W6MGQ0_9ASCO|nr:uncharacterized protein KUCA_T00000968001 [Kuraishia capsulata CBS 1993]CDK25001.1 unnamed protein product [Kuraishia capsulata CBS 1993]
MSGLKTTPEEVSEYEVSEAGVGNSETEIRGKFDPNTGVKRGLKTRHISMMALAGVIGPGVFVGMGSALHSGGPVGLIAGFCIVGLLVIAMMNCIGELNTLYDFNFTLHCSRWVDPGFGAAIGWCYVMLWLCNTISEYVSLTSILAYYTDKVPLYGWFLIMWFIFTVFQTLGVSAFGESEYILSFIKLLFLSGVYLFSIIYAAGGIPGHSPGNPFKEFPLAHGFKGIANSFVYAGVFYSGVEAVSMTTSEARNPKKAVPIAVRQTIWRILFVYLGASIAYGITVPWNDPNLSLSNKTMRAPITIALTNAGWANAGYFSTTIILVTCLSSINSSIYLASRSLFNLATEGNAPKIFSTVDKRGNPWIAIHVCHLFGFLSLLAISSGSSVAYGYIINLSGVCSFIVWTAIALAQIRFRKGWLANGYQKENILFQVPLYPLTSIFAVFLGLLLVLVQGWSTLKPFDAGNFVDVYIMIPVFFIMWAGYSFYYKKFWIPYHEMDFETGRKDQELTEDDLKHANDDPTEKSFFSRIWANL